MKKTCLLLLFLLSASVFLAFTMRVEPAGIASPCSSDTTGPVIFRAKDHKGKNEVSTSGVISFATGLDNDTYLVDSTNKIIYFYVETRLAKLLNLPVKRTPLNISIVIDRSGSMQGV